MKVSIYKSGIIACVILMVASYPAAANTWWQAGAGDWSVTTNWTSGEPDDYGDNALIDNGGTATISAPNAELCRYLYPGWAAGNSGSVEMSGGSLSTYLEYIGFHGTGSFTQSDGTHTIGDYIYLGYYFDGVGAYDISGGTLTVDDLYTGWSGSGTFKVTSGDATITVNNNYSVSNNSTLVSELCANGISLIDVSGSAYLDGTWDIIDSGSTSLEKFNVIEAAGGIFGTFDTVNLPNTTDWNWGITDTTGTDTLWVQRVPEPGTLLLLGLGGLALRRRRKV